MSAQAHKTGDDVLQRLLELAEQQQRHAGDGTDFGVCLIREVVSACGLIAMRVREIREVPGTAAMVLWSMGSFGGDAAGDAVICDLRPGSVRTTKRDEHGVPGASWVSATGAEVCDTVRIALEVQGRERPPEDVLLCDLAEVFADLRRRQLLQACTNQMERERRLNHVIALLHADLDESRIVNTIASDLPDLLDCARVSVVRKVSRQHWQVLASTAVAAPDPRSDAVRRIRRIAELAAARASSTAATTSARGQRSAAALPLSDEGAAGTPGFASETGGMAEDEGKALVQPLTVSGTWEKSDWAVVLEFRNPVEVVGDVRLLRRVCQHAALALSNSRSLSGSTVLGQLRKLPRRLMRTGVWAVLCGLVLAVTVLVWHQSELRIEVAGRLVPADRMYVFAPDDGVVSRILVDDGTVVSTGETLCELKNQDLELQFESTGGELAAAQARLAAIESLRGDRSTTQNGSISAEHAELSERSMSLQRQLQILSQRIENLTVRATRRGRVYGDRPRDLLAGRPVRRGQYLFEVADPEGDWELALDIDETDTRHVIAAMAAAGDALPVSFALETEPEQSRTTTLTGLSHAVQIDERGSLSTRGTAPFGHFGTSHPRPGSGVAGSIDCGPRSTGYVLFRRPFEFLQQQWRSRVIW